MNARLSLRPVDKYGWRTGFSNLWRKEAYLWWRNRNWLRQGLIWLLLLNGFYMIALFSIALQARFASGASALDVGLVFIVSFIAMFIDVGTIIFTQGAIVDEKIRGTAEWILSKPVSRTAFILSKCAALPGMLITMVLIPGLVAMLQIFLILGQLLSLTAILVLLGWLAGSLVFYFCLTLLLGTLFQSRVPIISISMFAILIVGQLAQQLPQYILTDQLLLPMLIVLALIGGAAICLLLAIKRFTQEEF